MEGITQKHRTMAWADGDFDADHGLAFDGVGGPLGSLEPGARPQRGGGGGCARALAVYGPPSPKRKDCGGSDGDFDNSHGDWLDFG
jgi:hypothetical protein